MSDIPPKPSHWQMAPTSQQPINQTLGHSRSLSQPALFSSTNCFPPLLNLLSNREPSPTSELIIEDVPMDDQGASSLPLSSHKGHRRSNSDMPLGFSAMIQSSPQLIPISGHGVFDRDDKPIHTVKQEMNLDIDCTNKKGVMVEGKLEGDVGDDLFNAFMNLGSTDPLNSSGIEEKDMDSRASRTKTRGGDGSDNEVESSVKGKPNTIHGGGLGFSNTRHFRSVSIDSFMGNMNIAEESPKLPLSLGTQFVPHSPSNSMDMNSAKFSLEFGNGEFNGAELKKIMANDKLAEIALSDPKRVKRILANRQSAARSKERKMRYISELEHNVQTLETEATTLSAQVTLLQRESAGLTSQNNELKFRLQAMEQQAQLKDALNEALTGEVQRLKLAAAKLKRS
ncbi:Transcription factor VIP1 [Camellia lanceoleosa]|uniref:Transcription factor VIP1 n=1 Tax=Camellia lanceoleosa TaxID=1840588 RepID=A0ACC0HSR3_9ERIC|nr:Transcription factor VIP1 [Camellia lanceoleosa]